jgi:hypothetical protein
MALGKISGGMLSSNLERDGNDLAFETDLLYLDVANGRIGVNTNTPEHSLHAPAGGKIGTITISGDSISGDSKVQLGLPSDIKIDGGLDGYVLTTDGNGVLSWASVGDLMAETNVTGMQVDLGFATAPTNVNVAWDQFTDQTLVTNAINELNQTALNIAKGTYVGAVDFASNATAGPSPLSVAFTPSYVGTPTDFLWDFGDGTTSTDEYPTHLYDNLAGGNFTVIFKAYNANGTLAGDSTQGAIGSWDDNTKSDYILLYTPTPIPSIVIGDSSIDTTTTTTVTNLSQYSTSYSIDWGDGTIATPASDWSSLDHTYINAGGDELYAVALTATSDTAGPTPVTVVGADANVRVYSIHDPDFTANTLRVVNQQATSGGEVIFTNITSSNPGNTSTFPLNAYVWDWGNGDINSITIQPGLAGNPGATLTHAFALTESNQLSGTTQTFDVRLSVLNGHSSSPFTKPQPITIVVEPEVRSEFSATSLTVSDRIGDTAQDGYVFTDYRTGANRAEFEFTALSQHATTYTWSFGDNETAGPLTDGLNGTVAGGPITHAYLNAGNKTVSLEVSGQPDTIPQTTVTSKNAYITIKALPIEPGSLSSKQIVISNESQGSSPLLAYSATNNTLGAIPDAGTAVTRIATLDNLVSTPVTGVSSSKSGTLSALVSGQVAGQVIFDSQTSKVGVYDSLSIIADGDAHDAISPSEYPSGLYKVFAASITHSFVDVSDGYNNLQMSHTTSGSTNEIGFVKDSLTAVPTIDISSADVTQKNAGDVTYISGIPYYSNGGVVSLNGVAVTNWIGQTYTDTVAPLRVASANNFESTVGSIVQLQNYSYADIDGASTYLNNGIPVANTGNTSSYQFGELDVLINGTAHAVSTLSITLDNVNGSSVPVELPTKINVYSQASTGVNELLIPVAPSLGGGFSDNGRRVSLGLLGDNPAYTPANFYVDNAWDGAELVAGTPEAIVRWGVLTHFDDEDFSVGYLPAGPDLVTDRAGAQYFTFAFRRSLLANFDITLTGKISGMWIAAPGTGIDSSADSTNGWLDCNASYAGAGLPGTNTAAGGNGLSGCAVTSNDRIPLGTVIDNQSYTMTIGSENFSNAVGKNCLVRIRLERNDYISAISIGVAS